MYSKYYNETSNKYKFNIIIKFLKNTMHPIFLNEVT